MYKKWVIFLLIIISCNKEKPLDSNLYMSNFKDINNKKIFFNTLIQEVSLINNLKLIFTGYAECNSCIITLKEIQLFLDNHTLKNELSVFYIASGVESEYFDYQIRKNNFTFTIIIDNDSSFIKKNKLYAFDHSTILLDKDNRVILVGNMFEDKEIFTLYNSLINEK